MQAEQIVLGATYIRQGLLVAFPTETVYGLGANAYDAVAVAKIFQAKGRPADNPLIVHIADREELDRLALRVSPAAQRLIDIFWPGPLSICLPRSERVPEIVTAGLDTVAVRMPNHPVALELIRAAGVPIAAPSANRSGRPSPTLAEHVRDDLGAAVDLVLDAGPAAIGLESTVIDMSGTIPLLLRPGAVTLEDLERVLGVSVAVVDPESVAGEAVRSPGLKYEHYAPQAPLYLFLGEATAVVAAQKARLDELLAEGKRVGILTYDDWLQDFPQAVALSLGHYEQPVEAASRLYSQLRSFDNYQLDLILAHGYPSAAGLGLALQNRLLKAAGFRIVWTEGEA